MAGLLCTGTEQSDTLAGGTGDDTLEGGAGRDLLIGRGGADLFRFSALTDSTRASPDGIRDFQHGVDRIDLCALGWSPQDIASGGRLKILYSDSSDRTYVRDRESDFSFYLQGDHRGQLGAEDFLLTPPKLLVLPFLGQSNALGMRFFGGDKESGVTRMVAGLREATGQDILSSWTDTNGKTVDLAVGASTVNGLSTATDAEKARTWWLSDTDQPGEALLRAADLLQEKLAVLATTHAEPVLSLIWGQGENAASQIYLATDKEAAAAAYEAATLKIFDYLQEQLGGGLTIYMMETGRIQEEAARAAGFSETKIQGLVDGTDRVHAVQERIAHDRADVKLAVNYADLAMAYEDGEAGHEADHVHLSNESREIIGDRLADYIAMDLGYRHILTEPGRLPLAALRDIALQPDPGDRFSVSGTDRQEVIVGTAGRDALQGASGDDTLIGGLGQDTLTGGAGADIFFYQSIQDSTRTGFDRILDFEQGLDRIDLRGLGYTDVVTGRADAGELRLSYSAANDRTYIKDSASDFLLCLDGDHMTLQASDFLF